MASEDKTYCGRGERPVPVDIELLMTEFDVSREEVLKVIEKLGNDEAKVRAHLKGRDVFY